MVEVVTGMEHKSGRPDSGGVAYCLRCKQRWPCPQAPQQEPAAMSEVDSGFTGGVRSTLPCGHDEEEHMAVIDREVWCAKCDKRVAELAVRATLAQLDGSTRSAVRLMTGFSDEKLDELGGFHD